MNHFLLFPLLSFLLQVEWLTKFLKTFTVDIYLLLKSDSTHKTEGKYTDHVFELLLSSLWANCLWKQIYTKLTLEGIERENCRAPHLHQPPTNPKCYYGLLYLVTSLKHGGASFTIPKLIFVFFSFVTH